MLEQANRETRHLFHLMNLASIGVDAGCVCDATINMLVRYLLTHASEREAQEAFDNLIPQIREAITVNFHRKAEAKNDNLPEGD